MKIGIVCYPTFGGSGVIATELGLALAEKGHKVHFITYKRPVRLPQFNENISFHEVNVLQYPLFEFTPYEASLASKLVDVVRFEKLDLLHVHYAIPHATVGYLAKQILKEKGVEIPIVTTLHGTDITLVGLDHSFRPAVEFGINCSDGVTSVSENLKQQTFDNFDIKNDIRVIYNFIDFERFKKTNKDHFKKAIAPNGEKIVTHVSNFRKVKRVKDVVKVFEGIVKEVPAKLFMIGDGPERQKTEELCRKLGLCDEIRFLGKQDAVEELLAISDLFLMPSAKESFGLAALEAMACEVPVVSSNAGGLTELNIHGTTGYVCEIGDVQSMINYSIEILKNEALAQQMKKAAFKQARKFDIDIVVQEYEEYYKEVLSEKGVTV